MAAFSVICGKGKVVFRWEASVPAHEAETGSQTGVTVCVWSVPTFPIEGAEAANCSENVKTCFLPPTCGLMTTTNAYVEDV